MQINEMVENLQGVEHGHEALLLQQYYNNVVQNKG